MTESHTWTLAQPDRPGWYWCQALGDRNGPQAAKVAEFIVRVDWYGPDLVATWMRSPGQNASILKSDWRPDALWCGPIAPPLPLQQ